LLPVWLYHQNLVKREDFKQTESNRMSNRNEKKKKKSMGNISTLKTLTPHVSNKERPT